MIAYRSLRCSVNWPIGKALVADAFQGHRGAFGIIQPALFPFAVHLDAALAVGETKIKLGAVALQVRFAHVVIGAYQTALDQAKERFNRVGVNIAACEVVNKWSDSPNQVRFPLVCGASNGGLAFAVRVMRFAHGWRVVRGS